MSKIDDVEFYCFAVSSILFGCTFISAGIAVFASANYSLNEIFGGIFGNALLATGGILIATGLIGMGIPKFRAILIKNNDETLQANVAKKVSEYLNDQI